jgi:magnesium-dependent phosphatase-1
MIYIFDLDLTLWDTHNKYNNPIWAKQLIPPYTINGDTVTDDVGSTCVLRKGVREYLSSLKKEGNHLGFVSIGAYYGLPFGSQPSYNLLNLFKIYDYFDETQVLKYKLYDKCDTIKNIDEKIVFYDDSPQILKSLEKFENVIAVDSSNIKDWNDLIGKNYD